MPIIALFAGECWHDGFKGIAIIRIEHDSDKNPIGSREGSKPFVYQTVDKETSAVFFCKKVKKPKGKEGGNVEIKRVEAAKEKEVC